jgi:hypothetical protein
VESYAGAITKLTDFFRPCFQLVGLFDPRQPVRGRLILKSEGRLVHPGWPDEENAAQHFIVSGRGFAPFSPVSKAPRASARGKKKPVSANVLEG